MHRSKQGYIPWKSTKNAAKSADYGIWASEWLGETSNIAEKPSWNPIYTSTVW